MLLRTLCWLLVFAPLSARAEQVCGERAEIVDVLESRFKEQRTAAGLSGRGSLVELFTAPSGSWTMILTVPGGPTCLLGSGEDWEQWKRVKPSQES